jgi:peptidoglycan-N-acetylglucosamine deacetylase
VLEIWQGELEWMHANVDGGVLTVCMHPQVIGRAHRIEMLDRFVAIGERLGVGFKPLGEVASRLASSS